MDYRYWDAATFVGWLAEEMTALGAPPYEKRGAASDEYVHAFRALWSGNEPNFEGTFVRTRDVVFEPKPVQQPGPPIWVGGEGPAARRRAGRIGDGWYPTIRNPREPLDTAEAVAAGIADVRKHAEAAGRDSSSISIAVHRPTFAWRDGDAWSIVRDYAHYMTWKYADMDEAYGSRERRLPPAITAETETSLLKRSIVGTPEQVAEQIAEYRDVLGPNGHFIARSYFPGLDPGIQRETMRIFGEEVRALLG